MEGTRGVTDAQMEGRGPSASFLISQLALQSHQTTLVMLPFRGSRSNSVQHSIRSGGPLRQCMMAGFRHGSSHARPLDCDNTLRHFDN